MSATSEAALKELQKAEAHLAARSNKGAAATGTRLPTAQSAAWSTPNARGPLSLALLTVVDCASPVIPLAVEWAEGLKPSEMVVVLSGSCASALTFGEREAGQVVQVEMVGTTSKESMASGFNLAAQVAESELIACLAPDARVSRHSLVDDVRRGRREAHEALAMLREDHDGVLFLSSRAAFREAGGFDERFTWREGGAFTAAYDLSTRMAPLEADVVWRPYRAPTSRELLCPSAEGSILPVRFRGATGADRASGCGEVIRTRSSGLGAPVFAMDAVNDLSARIAMARRLVQLRRPPRSSSEDPVQRQWNCTAPVNGSVRCSGSSPVPSWTKVMGEEVWGQVKAAALAEVLALRNPAFKIPPSATLAGVSEDTWLVVLRYHAMLRERDWKSLVVHTKHGLSNRLRAMASARALARATNRTLVVVWEPDVHCRARFGDLFDEARSMSRGDAPLWLVEQYRHELLVSEAVRRYNYMEVQGGAADAHMFALIRDRSSDHAHVYVRSAYVLNSDTHDYRQHDAETLSALYSALRSFVPVPVITAHVGRLCERLGGRAAGTYRGERWDCFRSAPFVVVGMHVRMRTDQKKDVPGIVQLAGEQSESGLDAMSDVVPARKRCHVRSFARTVRRLCASRHGHDSTSIGLWSETSSPELMGKPCKLYVAADSLEAHRHLRAEFGASSVFAMNAANSSLWAQSSALHALEACLEGQGKRSIGCQRQALIDQLMLAESTYLVTSEWSSYSDVAKLWAGPAVKDRQRSGCNQAPRYELFPTSPAGVPAGAPFLRNLHASIRHQIVVCAAEATASRALAAFVSALARGSGALRAVKDPRTCAPVDAAEATRLSDMSADVAASILANDSFVKVTFVRDPHERMAKAFADMFMRTLGEPAYYTALRGLVRAPAAVTNLTVGGRLLRLRPLPACKGNGAAKRCQPGSFQAAFPQVAAKRLWSMHFRLRNSGVFPQSVTFSQVLELLRAKVDAEGEASLPPSFQSQRHVCGLDAVRYHFVGRFENLKLDAIAMTQHLRGAPQFVPQTDLECERAAARRPGDALGSALASWAEPRRIGKLVWSTATVKLAQPLLAPDLASIGRSGITYGDPLAAKVSAKTPLTKVALVFAVRTVEELAASAHTILANAQLSFVEKAVVHVVGDRQEVARVTRRWATVEPKLLVKIGAVEWAELLRGPGRGVDALVVLGPNLAIDGSLKCAAQALGRPPLRKSVLAITRRPSPQCAAASGGSTATPCAPEDLCGALDEYHALVLRPAALGTAVAAPALAKAFPEMTVTMAAVALRRAGARVINPCKAVFLYHDRCLGTNTSRPLASEERPAASPGIPVAALEVPCAVNRQQGAAPGTQAPAWGPHAPRCLAKGVDALRLPVASPDTSADIADGLFDRVVPKVCVIAVCSSQEVGSPAHALALASWAQQDGVRQIIVVHPNGSAPALPAVAPRPPWLMKVLWLALAMDGRHLAAHPAANVNAALRFVRQPEVLVVDCVTELLPSFMAAHRMKTGGARGSDFFHADAGDVVGADDVGAPRILLAQRAHLAAVGGMQAPSLQSLILDLSPPERAGALMEASVLATARRLEALGWTGARLDMSLVNTRALGKAASACQVWNVRMLANLTDQVSRRTGKQVEAASDFRVLSASIQTASLPSRVELRVQAPPPPPPLAAVGGNTSIYCEVVCAWAHHARASRELLSSCREGEPWGRALAAGRMAKGAATRTRTVEGNGTSSPPPGALAPHGNRSTGGAPPARGAATFASGENVTGMRHGEVLRIAAPSTRPVPDQSVNATPVAGDNATARGHPLPSFEVHHHCHCQATARSRGPRRDGDTDCLPVGGGIACAVSAFAVLNIPALPWEQRPSVEGCGAVAPPSVVWRPGASTQRLIAACPAPIFNLWWWAAAHHAAVQRGPLVGIIKSPHAVFLANASRGIEALPALFARAALMRAGGRTFAPLHCALSATKRAVHACRAGSFWIPHATAVALGPGAERVMALFDIVLLPEHPEASGAALQVFLNRTRGAVPSFLGQRTRELLRGALVPRANCSAAAALGSPSPAEEVLRRDVALFAVARAKLAAQAASGGGPVVGGYSQAA